MANTSFTRDEAILALDVLHFADKLRLNKESHEIAELSELLNELPIIPLSARRENFRSKGGVNGQLSKFRSSYNKGKNVRAENCEIWHLNLSEIYKPTPGNFLQCHLTVPITELNSSKHYAADDFITVCPNCHAVLHRNRPWLTKDDAGKILF